MQWPPTSPGWNGREIPLRVLDDLGGFCNLDRRGLVNAGGGDRLIDAGDTLESVRVLAGDDLHNLLQGVLLVARIDSFRRVSELEIYSLNQSGLASKDRAAHLFGHAGIHGRFVDHYCAS